MSLKIENLAKLIRTPNLVERIEEYEKLKARLLELEQELGPTLQGLGLGTQPTSSTFRGREGSLKKKILNYLKDHPGSNARAIATDIYNGSPSHSQESSVRATLCFLAKKGLVHRPYRGLFTLGAHRNLD